MQRSIGKMAFVKYLADDRQLAGLIDDLADQIDRFVGRSGSWNLVGIRSRGDVLASRLAERLSPTHLGTLDITLYRDDLSEIGNQPVVRPTELDFAVDGCDLVLVDDVIMTGRSIRAAMQSIMDLGRPSRIWLAVLVDRGGRELPIQPDMVALDLTPGSTPGSTPGTALGTASGIGPNAAPSPGRPAQAVEGSGRQTASEAATQGDRPSAGVQLDDAGLLLPDQKVVVRLRPTDSEDAILLGKPGEKGQAGGD